MTLNGPIGLRMEAIWRLCGRSKAGTVWSFRWARCCIRPTDGLGISVFLRRQIASHLLTIRNWATMAERSPSWISPGNRPLSRRGGTAFRELHGRPAVTKSGLRLRELAETE